MTLHFRTASPRPTTFDREARTIEAVVSTGAPVARGGFEERLDLSGADLSRLDGAPLVDGHRAETTRDVIGVIEAPKIRDGAIWVRIKFRTNEAATAIMNDVADGTLRGLSVGYTVQAWRDSQEGNRRIRTATKWTPIEVSITPIPADPSAYFRSGASAMPEDNVTTTAPDNGQTTTQTTTQTQTRAQINREIRSMAQMANLPATWADEQIDAEASLDEAREAAFAAMQTRQAQTQTRSTRAAILHDNTDPAVIAPRMGEALYARAHPDHQVSDPAREYVGQSMIDLCRSALRAQGISTTGMHAESVVTRALPSTSTLPEALGESARRELRRTFQSQPSGARSMARQNTARDFRTKHKINMSEAPTLEKVNESGEFKSGAMHDSAETYRANTFGFSSASRGRR